MYPLQWTEQLAEGQVIGMGHCHDELEASLLPCVEADLQPHPNCSDLALTQCWERYFTFHMERATWVQVSTVFSKSASVQTAKGTSWYNMHHRQGNGQGDCIN